MRKDFVICVFLLVVLTGCASLMVREEDASEIQIFDTLLGGGLELSPPLLKIGPGQNVTWANHTTYDIQIQFEPNHSIVKRPSFIPRFSVAQGRFNAVGTYSYTLIFSSSRTFGRVTGTIVVEDPHQENKPFQNQPEEISPLEENPEPEPFII